jgi:hypothetical protein
VQLVGKQGYNGKMHVLTVGELVFHISASMFNEC